MGLFACEKCGCIENTALGHYWGRFSIKFQDGLLPAELVGKPLCSECTPAVYSDGSIVKDGGKWHDKFPKVHWSEEFPEKPMGTW